MRRETVLTKIVKEYDKALFVKRAENGMMFLLRNVPRIDAFHFNGNTYHYTKMEPKEILALTDTWTSKGQPIDCGIEPLMKRISEIDGYRSNEYLERVHKSSIEAQEVAEKRTASQFEDKAYQMADGFKKVFSDYNVSSSNKIDSRKILEKKGKLK